jgi:hypothetical protein
VVASIRDRDTAKPLKGVLVVPCLGGVEPFPLIRTLTG